MDVAARVQEHLSRLEADPYADLPGPVFLNRKGNALYVNSVGTNWAIFVKRKKGTYKDGGEFRNRGSAVDNLRERARRYGYLNVKEA